MGIYVVTGSASGIGAQTKEMLKARGDDVIGVDIKSADIVSDLSTQEGRVSAVTKIHELAREGIDGFIPAAGLGPAEPDIHKIVSVNYFAVRILTENLKDLLKKKNGSVVIISSNSAAQPGTSRKLTNIMLEENDEKKTLLLLKTYEGYSVYSSSKLALTFWMRRIASGWITEGVRVNAVVPGAVMTPLLQQVLDHPVYGDIIRKFKVPTGGFGTPEQIAHAILFLLSEQAAFCCGSSFFVDGGTDALLQSDHL